MRARIALVCALLADAAAVRAQSALVLRLPQEDVDRCFPFRGNFHNGCAFVDAMCEQAKFPEDVMAPSWCSTYAHDTHALWQQCEKEVQLGDRVLPFVDSDQWTALWDQGGNWATFDAKCHWEDPKHCPAIETISFSRLPQEPNRTAPPPGTLFPDPPKPDFFVVTGNATGNRSFLVDNGRLVQVVDGALVHTGNVTVNGRGELVWPDGTTSRREGGPPPGYGLNFVTCLAQQPAPPCVDMCAGHTPAGPCPRLCLALSGCRASCSAFGSDSRYDVQSCINSCLLRTAPKEEIPATEPCPAGGCAHQPAPPPNGLSPEEGQNLAWQLGNLTEEQDMLAAHLANATAERDVMRDEFKQLLMDKIAGQDAPVPVPLDVLAGNGTNATDANATDANGTEDVAPVPVPAPVMPAASVTTPAPAEEAAVERSLSPAASAQMEALSADIASTQAQVNAVYEEQAAYQEQINILNSLR